VWTVIGGPGGVTLGAIEDTPTKENTMHRSLLLAVPAAVALLAAGCGSNGNGSASGSSGGIYGSSGTQAPATNKPIANKGAAAVKVAHGPLGAHLVNANGRTLYLFEADKGTKSACTGACAKAWPPLTTTGKPKASAGAKASLLRTAKRADGSIGVTYGGHPLYTFIKDTKAGQTAGQGVNAFGGLWYVVATNGKAITKP
jgi:predicted lipoprotein with Yx(FWY)xxD motif